MKFNVNKSIEFIYKSGEYGLLILNFVIFLIVCNQIFFRYVLKSSLVWSEEITRYLLVWLTFLGFSCNVKTDSLPRITAFISLFPIIIRRALRIFGRLCFLIVSLVIMWQGIKLVIQQISTGRTCSSLPLPIFCFTVAIPFAFLLSSIYLLKFIWMEIHNFRKH